MLNLVEESNELGEILRIKELPNIMYTTEEEMKRRWNFVSCGMHMIGNYSKSGSENYFASHKDCILTILHGMTEWDTYGTLAHELRHAHQGLQFKTLPEWWKHYISNQDELEQDANEFAKSQVYKKYGFIFPMELNNPYLTNKYLGVWRNDEY